MDPFVSQLRVEPGRRGFWEPGRPTAHVGPRASAGPGLVGVLRLLQTYCTFLAKCVSRSLTSLLAKRYFVGISAEKAVCLWLLTYTQPPPTQ